MKIGKLEKVELRELWRHEEHGFSVWLENNLDALGDALELSLSDPQREVSAGTFSVDLVADGGNAGRVIIENQLEPTNHDHLGKILTYLTNLEAKIAIWITKSARPEHIKAITWLNETTPDDISFFLVKLEAYRIGGSDPAPLFTVIVGPSAESKGFGQQKKDLAERHMVRLRFWESLLARAKAQGLNLHSSRSPTVDNWLSAGSGRSGITFNYVIWKEGKTAAEVYIDTRDKDENKKLFDEFFSKKGHIEKAFGGELNWQRLDDGHASKIRHQIDLGGLNAGEEKWPAIQDAMIDAMKRLYEAFRPIIKANV